MILYFNIILLLMFLIVEIVLLLLLLYFHILIFKLKGGKIDYDLKSLYIKIILHSSSDSKLYTNFHLQMLKNVLY